MIKKINFHSIIFKTITSLMIFSTVFILIVTSEVKNVFTSSYMNLEKDKVELIAKHIQPQLALNLSYDFSKAINEIINKTLENPNVLLIEIKEDKNPKTKIYTKQKFTKQEYIKNNEFINTKILRDPVLDKKIGEFTIIYSTKNYLKYIKQFNDWFYWSVASFLMAILIMVYLLYKSLKNLTILDKALKAFNPKKPKKLELQTSNKDEISSISDSANTMIENIISFLNNSKQLNEQLLQSQLHLKDAQRMAKVGSFSYDLVKNELILSDEYYRILSIKQNKALSWEEFLSFISKNDINRVKENIENAITKGSKFSLKYSITLNNQKYIYIQTKGKVRKRQSGDIKITAISMDITADIENKKIIEKLAYYDPLTGLANRALLKDRLHKAIHNAKREKTKLAIIFLDLDHFKLINDTLGHSVGDELLIYISQILKSQIRESDTLSRLGGDEFVILLPSIKKDEDAHKIAHKIQIALQDKHDIGIHQLYITSSIGVAVYPEHGINSDELIRNADTAMYEAKNGGRNKYKIYSHTMGSFIDKQLNLEQELIEAIKTKDEIEVYFQAKVDTVSQMIIGAEALVRWNHPTKGLIFPDSFIHIAESTGLMIELGNIITEKSIATIKELNQLGFAGLKIAINLSARQFQDSTLVPFILTTLNKYDIDSSQVEFEITESISMSNMNNTLRILSELKDVGLSIAIDDFGTGHSSLSYLKKFPIDILKIDKSFVDGIINDEEDRVIAQTIISMAHSLGLKTVAEGVETKEHVNMLQNMECDILQGYFFSKPISKDNFINFLKEYKINN